MITEVTPATTILAEIQHLDRHGISVVQAALSAHSKHLHDQEALLNQATLLPGTRVITKGLRPKYLNGLHATVLPADAKRKGDILVEVDQADRYFVSSRYMGSSGRLGVPAACLERQS
jgi:hypothetical protein